MPQSDLLQLENKAFLGSLGCNSNYFLLGCNRSELTSVAATTDLKAIGKCILKEINLKPTTLY